ncbi:MAG: hypothetical protein ACPKM0_08465 [Pleomorphochaeta sp.]
MNIRQSFHIYKIIEDFSKQFISFDYSPEYRIFNGYYLSHKQVENILEENGELIKALYEKNETKIKEILNKDDILIDEFESAQTEENIKNKKNKEAPLPIQARYVLKGFNYLRINEKQSNKDLLINQLNKRAFKESVFPQITKMALSFENTDFYNNAILALYSCSTKEQYMLFYKLLAYYFRINKNEEYKENALTVARFFEEDIDIDIKLINKVDSYIKDKATL